MFECPTLPRFIYDQENTYGVNSHCTRSVDSHPTLPLRSGSLSFGDWERVLAIDPGERLLTDLVDAWAEAAPTLAEPSLQSIVEDTGSTTRSETPALPPLTVYARRAVCGHAFEDPDLTRAAVELADFGLLSVRLLGEAQSTPTLIGPDRQLVVVDFGGGREAIKSPSTAKSLDLPPDAPTYRFSMPSRRRIYRAFRDRCGAALAEELLAGYGSCTDLTEAQLRAIPYLVGARHGALHYSLRKAGEDAGVASPATLSKVKCRLVESGVIETKPVPQPVGRPRERLVPVHEWINSEPIEEISRTAATVLNGGATEAVAE